VKLWIGRAAMFAVLAGAAMASVHTLMTIAARAELFPTVALPLMLDGMGVCAAMAVRADRRDPIAWGTVCAATGMSAVLQWMHAPPGLEAHLVHGAPPVAVLLSFELFVRATGREDVPADVPAVVRPELVPDLQVEPVNAESTVPAVVHPVGPAVPRPRPAKQATRASTRRSTSAPRSFDPDGKDEALWDRSRKAAADLGRPLETLTRDELLGWLKSKGWGVRATRVDDVLRYAKEHA
jgi:hypothetical protein